MNKKNLSVVMAGAMLATSVAPVLADSTSTEIGLSQTALLRNQIKNKMAEKYLSTNAVLRGDKSGSANANEFLSNEVKAELTENKDASAYGIKVLDKDGKEVDLNDLDSSITDNTKVIYKVTEMEKVLNSTSLKEGYTIQVLERYTTDFMGQLIPGTAITAKTDSVNYVTTDITTNIATTQEELKPTSTKITTNSVFVDTVTAEKKSEVSAENDKIKVTLNKITDINDAESKQVIELTTDNKKLDGRLPLDKDRKLLDVTKKEDIQKFDHFAELVDYNISQSVATAPTVVESYKLVDDGKDDTKENYAVSDLYDGFALTAKGTELLSDLENAAEKADEKIGQAPTGSSSTTVYPKSLVQLQHAAPAEVGSTGIYSFTIRYYNSVKDLPADKQASDTVGKPAKVVTVKSTNKTEIDSLYNMLKDGSFKVGIVGGDNRYETAVNVAKANKTALNLTSGADYNAHIVLVNGMSLVDGLAAAPFAASINNNDTNGTASTKVAPVLLTESDKLSAATKDYINELTNEITPAQRKNVTIDLVGGEAVLTTELESELKAMGFKVDRYGGENREETSLEVAEAIVKSGTANDAFVVGGNGEADAMSIAPVAVSKKHGASSNAVAPIIVSNVNGLSKDAIKFLDKNAKIGDVTIVGGESAVSKEEAQKIDETVTNKVVRLDGANRFETNAKVIETYYKTGGTITGTKGIVTVKDGQKNKSELIDALSAANYAASAEMNGPIVLASSNVKDVQKNALLNVNGTVEKVAQVGVGAERTVIETIADLFGVSNTK